MAIGNVLVFDIGGTTVKMSRQGSPETRNAPTGPAFGPADFVAVAQPAIAELGGALAVVAMPGPVVDGRLVEDPPNLGPGWVGFDFEAALGRPTRVENDAALQALGAYRGGRMLFVGLGTGTGSALVVDGTVIALELAHLPFHEATFEDYLGIRGLERLGSEAWERTVGEVVEAWRAATSAQEVVLGGGLVHRLASVPPGCRRGEGDLALRGGIRLWERPPAPHPPPSLAASWRALAAHRHEIADRSLRDLLAEPERVERMVHRVAGLRVDLTRHLVTDRTLELLLDLARAAGVEGLRDRMFAGESINTTEQRAVAHVALRNLSSRRFEIGGSDVMPAVRAALEHVDRLAIAVRSGAWRGATGEPIREVVNIGIGGSDLGPAMVVEALGPYAAAHLRSHFVSNVDGADLARTLAELDPARTLFIVASKTFTTQETLVNAASARRWLVASLGEAAVARHFVAISSNATEVARFGIDPQNMIGFWDWVGGRYSLWSAIGLPIAIAVGPERFRELLRGAHELDEHFRSAPMEANVPILLALLGVWYRNFRHLPAHAVLPYDQRLRRFPAYLQQADMESNGKGVDRDGRPVGVDSGPIVFGEPGTNGQHAFFQLLHQGSTVVPMDLLGAVRTAHPLGEPPGSHQRILLANLVAQAEAFAIGRTAEEARAELEAAGANPQTVERLLPHKVFPGNRPSTVILYERLDPFTLGALIALYEHRIFAMGAIWNLNSFDQWGVELGKLLAGRVLPELEGGPSRPHDPATTALIDELRRRLAASNGGLP